LSSFAKALAKTLCSAIFHSAADAGIFPIIESAAAETARPRKNGPKLVSVAFVVAAAGAELVRAIVLVGAAAGAAAAYASVAAVNSAYGKTACGLAAGGTSIAA
jgi:hypothetical protein